MILNWEFYKQKYKDLRHLKNEKEVQEHFVNYGIKEERVYVDIPILFDWKNYLIQNADLQKDIREEEVAWKHFLYHGKKEKRHIINRKHLIIYCM